MRVNSINSRICFNKNNLKEVSEKRAYIDSKTQGLDEFSALLALGALTTEIIDTPVVTNSKKSVNKLSLGLLIASLSFILISCIKKHSLSKEYDNIKENSHDSKNNA